VKEATSITNATFETAKVQAVRNYRSTPTGGASDESQETPEMYATQGFGNAAEDEHL